MELNDVKSLWQAYDSKLERSLKLNLHCLDLIQAQKVKSQLEPIRWYRAIELTFHLLAIALLVAFLISNISDWRYALSAFSLLIFYVLASANCIKQLVIIKRMDYSNDVITIQSSLVQLRTHMVNLARIAVLCIPTFLAYPMVVSKAIEDLGLTGLSFMDIRAGYQGNWWTIQTTISIILLPLCVLFYKLVSYRNIHIDWVKDTIETFAGSRVKRSMIFINELESLKKDVI